MSHIHEFTPLTVQMLGVVKQLKFWCRRSFKKKTKKKKPSSEIRLCLHIQPRPDARGSPYEALLG